MLYASDWEEVSIRGRFAFALACLETMAEQWAIRGDYFNRLPALHWQFTSRPVLVDKAGGDWFKEVLQLRGDNCQDFVNRLREDNPRLSANQLHAVWHALGELWVIAGRDMYQEPQVWNTIAATLNVAGILLRWGLPLPPVAPFARSRWGEPCKSGDPRPREFFRNRSGAGHS